MVNLPSYKINQTDYKKFLHKTTSLYLTNTHGNLPVVGACYAALVALFVAKIVLKLYHLL